VGFSFIEGIKVGYVEGNPPIFKMTTFMRLKTPFQARSPITALSAARTQTLGFSFIEGIKVGYVEGGRRLDMDCRKWN
jgi:hypothetical protein